MKPCWLALMILCLKTRRVHDHLSWSPPVLPSLCPITFCDMVWIPVDRLYFCHRKNCCERNVLISKFGQEDEGHFVFLASIVCPSSFLLFFIFATLWLFLVLQLRSSVARPGCSPTRVCANADKYLTQTSVVIIAQYTTLRLILFTSMFLKLINYLST